MQLEGHGKEWASCKGEPAAHGQPCPFLHLPAPVVSPQPCPSLSGWHLLSGVFVSSAAKQRLALGKSARALPVLVANTYIYSRARSLSSCVCGGGTLHSQSHCLQRNKIKLRGPLLDLSSRIHHSSWASTSRGPEALSSGVCLVVKARCRRLGMCKNLEPLGFGVRY